MTRISFDIPDTDREAFDICVSRACVIHARYCADLAPLDTRSLQMDLAATHANGCPLDFVKLSTSADTTLAHDVFGILQYLDRDTGKLLHDFLPKCAMAPAPFTYVINDTITNEYVGGASAPLTPWLHLAARFTSADEAGLFIRDSRIAGLRIEPVSRTQIEDSIASEAADAVARIAGEHVA